MADSPRLPELPLGLLVRYGYAGFLLVGLAALFRPDPVKGRIEALGAVVAPITILAAGACIYTLYRYLLGEYGLYPLMHWCHWIADRRWSHRATISSPTGWLGSLGVPFRSRRSAYSEIRQHIVPDTYRERFDYVHTEIHILYLTVVECAAAGLYAVTAAGLMSHRAIGLLLIAGACFFAAVVADVRQHRREFRFISKGEHGSSVERFLRENGYVNKDEANPTLQPAGSAGG